MACELKICFMVSMLVSFIGNLRPLVYAESQVPCFFIFGDSLVDNGNNNGLNTIAKANYLPYGIDFPGGPTGRFSNGRNMADFIAQFLGFNHFIPPFATARGREILTGVNYGSAGAGIRDETGKQLGSLISMKRQLQNHHVTVSRSRVLLGSRGAAADHHKKCIYYVGMGSNDYINNYMQPQSYNTSRRYTPDRYAQVLIKQYYQQLKTLYNYGARKVAIFGLGLIGCTPAEIATYGTNGSVCVNMINNDVQFFNTRLKSLVDELNNELTNAKFIFINITGISLGDPSAAGITAINVPCCDVVSTTGQCAPNQVPCSNRSTYQFFDAFHPTEIANFLVATRSYSAQLPIDAHPFDIKRLAQL